MSYISEITRCGREPFAIVELHMDRCTRTFGVAPCNATGDKCYQTLATCKFDAAYSAVPFVYTFCTMRAPFPVGLQGAIPCIDSLSISPARIDPKGGLGIRGEVSVTLRDMPHNDRGFDPYVSTRTYDPYAQGTLFGRFKARNLYYNGRKLVVKIGYLDANGNYDAANFRTYTYFIDRIDGPDRGGSFKIIGKDILKQLDDKRAQAPKASVGKLLADILSTDLACTLVPVGVGDADYPASGLINLEGEVCSFTRSGDALTLVRGQYNTMAEDHDKDTTAQLCLQFSGITAQNIVKTLIVDYANVPLTFIPVAEWNQEQTDYLPRLYSALIAVPTGVKQLCTEILDQVGATLWWDEESALIRFRAIRPLGNDVVTGIGEHSHLLRDSLAFKDDVEARLTEVWIYHGMIDPTQDFTNPTNFNLVHVELDSAAESERQHNDVRVKTIFSRWITALNNVAAQDLGQKTLARFRKVPRTTIFDLDVKDSEIKPGDFVQVSSRLAQNPDGSSAPVNIQILTRKFKKLGAVTQYEGSEFHYLSSPVVGPTGRPERLIVIALSVRDLNLRTVHDAIYADLQAGDVIRVRILADVAIGASSVNNIAFDTGVWPTGVTLLLESNSGVNIGGAGGDGADYYAGVWTPPKTGGTAMKLRHPIKLVSGVLTVAGGGGGGSGVSSAGAYVAGGGGNCFINSVPGKAGRGYTDNLGRVGVVQPDSAGDTYYTSAKSGAAKLPSVAPVVSAGMTQIKGNIIVGGYHSFTGGDGGSHRHVGVDFYHKLNMDGLRWYYDANPLDTARVAYTSSVTVDGRTFTYTQGGDVGFFIDGMSNFSSASGSTLVWYGRSQ